MRMNRNLVFGIVLVTACLQAGCESSRLRLRTTTRVVGTLIPTSTPGESVFSSFETVTVNNNSVVPQLPTGQLICTDNPLHIIIKAIAGYQFHVLFGPNGPGDAPACGWITDEPATFNILGTMAWLWGTLPRTHSARISAHVSATTYIHQVFDTEERIFLIGPAGGTVTASCLIGSLNTTSLGCGDKYLSVKSTFAPTGKVNGCTITPVSFVDVVGDPIHDQIEAWKVEAKKAMWPVEECP